MFKKILLGIGIFLVLLLGAAIILPFVYKDKIVSLIKEEVNKNIHATVDFGEIDLTLLSTFPDFSVRIDSLSIVGKDTFDGDTLTAVPQLSVSLDLMSVLGGSQIEINSVKLQAPLFNLIVLKDGKANWDIAMADSTPAAAAEPATAFKATLQSYSIENGQLFYDDASLGFRMHMRSLNHSGKGDFTQDLFVLSTMTEAAAANLWYGGVKYLHEAKTALKADLDMDMPNFKFTFKENELRVNELVVGLDGWLAMPAEDIAMDLKLEARQNEFKNFVSMIPGVYKEGFDGLKSSGTLSLKAYVKGTYNEQKMPGFGLSLKVGNGMFQYPSLPVAVNNVQMDLQIVNPDGVPDHTQIDLNKLHVELGREPFDATLRVRTPVSDASIQGIVKGKVDFSNIRNIVPLESGTSIAGVMNANLTMNGRMSAIEQKHYEDFEASGSLVLENFNYNSKDFQQGFDLQRCELKFNPQNVTLSDLVGRAGKSDFKAQGTLDNLLAYLFKDETLRGTLNLQSNTIDLSELNAGSEANTTAADTVEMQMIEVPGNIDFTGRAQIGRLHYEHVLLNNVVGKMVIRNQAVNMENLSFSTLGGTMKMSGSYATPERKKANIALNMDISDFDIQQTVRTFATAKKIAPIAEKASGNFSSSFTMNGVLNEKMEPDLNSLSGGGKLSTANVIISNFAPLQKVAEALKLEEFKQLRVSNVNLSFSFENGGVQVKPFDVNLAGIPTNVSGRTGFDQSLDYNLNMNIPTAKLPTAATGAVNSLLAKANAAGARFSMAENVRMALKIGGTVQNPKITTDIKETTGKAVDALKDKAKEEVDRLKKEAEAKARAEAERLKAEGEAKAKAEADRLKKEAEEKLKQEKEKMKKDAEKKAKDALKNVFGPKK